MRDAETRKAHEETLMAWNANAAMWDERMGEGNDFVETLIWPPTQRLLALRTGERVLEIGCGNGLYARRLAALGADVLATDFASEMIALARARPVSATGRIDYRVLDATDEAALLGLGERSFDAAICMMALFDMSEISPLLHALARLLRPDGRFIFAIMHPCFNNPSVIQMGEQEDRAGRVVTTFSVKISRYMTPFSARGAALREQFKPHIYFHRSLQDVLGAAFAAGFIVDALEERAFPPDHPPGRHPFGWGANFSEIPPVLMARLRLLSANRRS
jgi:2-polyprenyl-3-methyl-5-hydroxy-6-metoxy-1,4-benzoquinol methylase